MEASGLEFSKIAIDGTIAASMSAGADVTDSVDAVKLSQEVMRWLDKADETYRAVCSTRRWRAWRRAAAATRSASAYKAVCTRSVSPS